MDFAGLTHLLIAYRYWLLFPLACIEGPLVALVAGVLIALGYFNPLLAYVILLFGDLIPDTIYYFIGRYGGWKSLIKRYGSKIGITDEHTEKVSILWKTHGVRTMWMGKLSYGLSIPFLISAGLVGMPLKRFLQYAIPVTLFQYGVLMALGYYLGNFYALIAESVFGLELLIAGVALAFAGYYIFTVFMKKKVQREQALQNEQTHI